MSKNKTKMPAASLPAVKHGLRLLINLELVLLSNMNKYEILLNIRIRYSPLGQLYCPAYSPVIAYAQLTKHCPCTLITQQPEHLISRYISAPILSNGHKQRAHQGMANRDQAVGNNQQVILKYIYIYICIYTLYILLVIYIYILICIYIYI